MNTKRPKDKIYLELKKAVAACAQARVHGIESAEYKKADAAMSALRDRMQKETGKPRS